MKVRNVNDYHHAQDAYLNIVVGNSYDVKFTKSPMNFVKEYNMSIEIKVVKGKKVKRYNSTMENY